MTTKRTAREFWIESPQEGNRAYSFKSVSPVGEQIHVREVLPDEITDTERLEWLIENAYTSDIRVRHHDSIGTLREAIDAAIREGKKL